MFSQKIPLQDRVRCSYFAGEDEERDERKPRRTLDGHDGIRLDVGDPKLAV